MPSVAMKKIKREESYMSEGERRMSRGCEWRADACACETVCSYLVFVFELNSNHLLESLQHFDAQLLLLLLDQPLRVLDQPTNSMHSCHNHDVTKC